LIIEVIFKAQVTSLIQYLLFYTSCEETVQLLDRGNYFDDPFLNNNQRKKKVNRYSTISFDTSKKYSIKTVKSNLSKRFKVK